VELKTGALNPVEATAEKTRVVGSLNVGQAFSGFAVTVNECPVAPFSVVAVELLVVAARKGMEQLATPPVQDELSKVPACAVSLSG
jgi:hypothetical protein